MPAVALKKMGVVVPEPPSASIAVEGQLHGHTCQQAALSSYPSSV